MPFTVTFDVSSKVLATAVNTIVWEQVKRLPQKTLLSYIYKFLKSSGYSITFRDCDDDLGVNFHPDHDIHISSTRLSFSELTGVIIHEIYHSVFAQLEEDAVLDLERRTMRRLTIPQANRILHLVFQKSRWKYVGPLIKKVGVLGDPVVPKVKKKRSK